MKINTKIMLLISSALILASAITSTVAIWQMNRTGAMSIEQIERLGFENIQKIKNDGIEGGNTFYEELLLQKKEYLKSQVQTTISLLREVYKDPLNRENPEEDSQQEDRNTAGSVSADRSLAVQKIAADLIQALRYGPEDKDYFWINDMRPFMIMHPYQPELNGQDLSNYQDPDGKRLFVEFVKICREKGEGFVVYKWPKYGSDKPQPTLSFVKLFKEWDWVIGTGIYIDDIEILAKDKRTKLREQIITASDEMKTRIEAVKSTIQKNIRRVTLFLGITILVVLAAALIVSSFFTRHSITNPLARSIDFATKIAEGDFTHDISIDQKDEIGNLVQSLNNMGLNMSRIIHRITRASEALAFASMKLLDISQELTTGTDMSSEKTTVVSASAHEVTHNIQAVAAAMEEASVNVNMVATAAEEMTSTINEIARNSEKARGITNEAVTRAQGVSSKLNELGHAAQEVGKVTETITKISEQTNLLALNATIEAMRAGETGKGFAVVANEIKELARQTAEATKEIKEKIQGIQHSTTSTVSEIEKILVIISDVDENVSGIANAVEEQSATTQEIANSSIQVSTGLQEVNTNVAQTATIVGEVTKDISEVSQKSNDISTSSSQVNENAQELKKLAEDLNEIVGQFKIK